MDILFETNLVQNSGLASCAVFEAIAAFCRAKNGESGLPFPFVFLVLPFVFHKRTADDIKTRSGNGTLFKAIKDDPELIVGLQARMESLYGKTLEALTLALAAKTVELDPETGELFSCRKSLPPKALPNLSPGSDILKASKRIGKALAEHSPEEILKLLKVVF